MSVRSVRSVRSLKNADDMHQERHRQQAQPGRQMKSANEQREGQAREREGQAWANEGWRVKGGLFARMAFRHSVGGLFS